MVPVVIGECEDDAEFNFCHQSDYYYHKIYKIFKNSHAHLVMDIFHFFFFSVHKCPFHSFISEFIFICQMN